MNRREAILAMVTLLASCKMKTNEVNSMTTTKMPALFIGHGSPMKAIEQDAFSETLNLLGKNYPRPKAIVCISAHWLTAGTWVTHMPKPKTIHDFYGFPQELFNVQYNAPGEPQIAESIKATLKKPLVQLNEDWGLDHGTWSVLKHMYPAADIPVIQLSIDMSEPPEYHFEMGKKLEFLRHQGVLILGSGNIVHNLRQIRWGKDSVPHAWAMQFDQEVKKHLEQRDFAPLMGKSLLTEAGRLSVPTPDHYYPMLYVLGASSNDEKMKFEYEGLEMGSLSMRSVSFGAS